MGSDTADLRLQQHRLCPQRNLSTLSGAPSYQVRQPNSSPHVNNEVRKINLSYFFHSTMLSLGKKKPWQEAFKSMTGYTNLTADPIKDYFRVLYDWMKEQRRANNYPIGWSATPTPSRMPTPSSKGPTTKDPDSSAVVNQLSGLLHLIAIIALFFKLH